MSTTKNSRRFTRAGVFVIDTKKQRRAGFSDDVAAQAALVWIRSGLAKIEDYIWEDYS